MRRIASFLTLAFLLIGVLLVACKKDMNRVAPSDVQQNIQKSEKKKENDCYKGVEVKCNMLSFRDQDQFNSVYDCLTAAYESWLDDFESQYGNLSEDDYNDMADNIGFVDEQPLIDFESSLAFSSYRAHLAELEDTWLQNGADDNSCPLDNDLFADDVMATLYNKDGAVMIGGTIFYNTPDGTTIEIPNGDCDLYECIRDGKPDCNEGPVVFHKVVLSDCGPDFARKDSTLYFDGDKRKVVWHMRFQHTGGFLGGQHKTISQIWSFKKKNGHWKKRRIDLAENLHGEAYNPEKLCDKNTVDELQAPKRRRTRTNHKGFWPKFVLFAVKDKSLWTSHYFAGNTENDYLPVAP